MTRDVHTGTRIVTLAGGVGGSRFARGLIAAAPAAVHTVIVNTGDDLSLYGLRISPDVDTVLYALSGRVDNARGWGPRGDSYRCMELLEELGGSTWFRLGDLDLAVHLRRTELLANGRTPTEVVAELSRRLGIAAVTILPMTNERAETWVRLAEGSRPWVHFQEYFVRRRTDVSICGVEVRGVADAAPAPGVLEALDNADLIVFAPSNPLVSLAPILAVKGIRESIRAHRLTGRPVGGISPLIGGATVKGPAARMLAELGHTPSALGAAKIFSDLLTHYVVDPVDRDLAQGLAQIGVKPLITPALMRGRRGEARLARFLLNASLGSTR